MSKTILLDAAVNEIQQACDVRYASHLPYFFLVGAGLSFPPVKLAAAIVDECRVKARGFGREVELAPDAPAVEAYSHWFSQAFPQLIQRQQYLAKLIKEENISQASFRLAHLLLEKRITNLVVTPNFDDFLLRALTLFGNQPIVCDHPRTVERIDPDERDNIQIVHVHGTYWFYDCVNLKQEIDRRAQSSAQTTSTMASLLDIILFRRVPLVIGYSGWEGDVLMSALFRRLNEGRRLTNRLYWFCYRRSVIDSLPEWLTSHEDVFFVVPPPAKEAAPKVPAPAASEQGKLSGGARSMEGLPANAAGKAADGKDAEPSLEATQVLDKLIAAFNIDSPVLTQNPLHFFANHLRRSLPDDDTAAAAEDKYLFKSVIERIERARQKEEEEGALETQLEQVRDALRRSQYREVIQKGLALNYHLMNPRQQYDLLQALNLAAGQLGESDEEILKAYDVAVDVSDLLSASGAAQPDVPKLAAQMLMAKARVADKLQLDDVELAAYDKVLKKFGDSTDPEVQPQVARALYNKGVALGLQDRTEEELAAYEEVVRRFGGSGERAIQGTVSAALFNKGYGLGEQERYEEELAAYDELVRRFGASDDPDLSLDTAMALLNKGYRMGLLGRTEEELATYEELFRRFGASENPAMHLHLAKAFINKGSRLGILGRKEEATAAYAEVEGRYGATDNPEVRGQVSLAVNNIGFDLLCEAKRVWLEGDEDRARSMLAEAEKTIVSATGYDPQNSYALGNYGYIRFLLGDRDQALQLLTEAIAVGGETIRETELNDADIHSLPQDEEFRELVRSIPAPQAAATE